jgi:hypothetical protein
MSKKEKKSTEQITINDGECRQFIWDWFAEQSDNTKLAALILRELTLGDIDKRAGELADEISAKCRRDLLSRFDRLSTGTKIMIMTGVLFGIENENICR